MGGKSQIIIQILEIKKHSRRKGGCFFIGYLIFPPLLRYFFMIKLAPREMKNLSRILTVILCCVPALAVDAAPVATTAGNNLTAYNPSNAYNNQWATISNGRYDGVNNTSAKVDFGNCNAVVLRCAQPKCGSGCTDVAVAAEIVNGCVKSNEKCKKYGDDLVNYMTAQLVANSNAKINEQNMALQQAKIQAEAQAAAAAAANTQSQEQISQMQQQIQQMQTQMYQQQQESEAQLQAALEQQAAQSAAALDNMKAAATQAAQQTEAGITSYQQEAINRGISQDVLARQQITGQIMTEIENAEVSLKAVKTAMQNSFDYAGCDARGNNCTGPKRIKKWRELATGFLEPYDNTIDKIYDALMLAQTVGVDLSQIYMMLNDSCNSWGQYMCEKGGDIDYSGSIPMSCPKDMETLINECMNKKCKTSVETMSASGVSTTYSRYDETCSEQCRKSHGCKPCTLLKLLADQAEVYEGWINPTTDETQNGTVVSCASGALDSSKLFVRRTKNKNGAGLVDIDELERWLYQVEPNNAESKENNDIKSGFSYCKGDEAVLEQAIAKRSVRNLTGRGSNLCVKELGTINGDTDGECTYINQIFGICDTHPFNAGKSWDKDKGFSSTDQEYIRKIIGLKITVVSQQMYKQYEYLKATLKRLQIQLEKAVLTANLEAAGAKSENGTSSGGLVGSKSDSDKTIHLSGASNCSTMSNYGAALDCISNNVNLISTFVKSQKKNACLQLQETVYSLYSITPYIGNANTGQIDNSNLTACTKYNVTNEKSCKDSDIDHINTCINEVRKTTMRAKQILENEQNYNRYGRW